MGTKRKLNPLATALVAADALSPEETTTLLDYLRGKQPKTPRKAAAKKDKTDKADKTEKADKGPTRLPDNPENFLKDSKAS